MKNTSNSAQNPSPPRVSSCAIATPLWPR
jgi:hypothetical protein